MTEGSHLFTEFTIKHHGSPAGYQHQASSRDKRSPELCQVNHATTGPGDTSETESEKRVFALFGAPGVWGSPLQTHTPGALYSTGTHSACVAHLLMTAEK